MASGGSRTLERVGRMPVMGAFPTGQRSREGLCPLSCKIFGLEMAYSDVSLYTLDDMLLQDLKHVCIDLQYIYKHYVYVYAPRF